jgi:hypothetical protein
MRIMIRKLFTKDYRCYFKMNKGMLVNAFVYGLLSFRCKFYFAILIYSIVFLRVEQKIHKKIDLANIKSSIIPKYVYNITVRIRYEL